MGIHGALRIAVTITLCISIGEVKSQECLSLNPGLREDDKGTIISSKDSVYTSQYLINQDCTWDVPKRHGYQITLRVESFDLQELDNDVCNDYVAINGRKYCGHYDEGFTFNGPYVEGVTIRFKSDATEERAGFAISYTQEAIPVCDVECANGGSCVGTNKCLCTSAFAGLGCSYQIVPEKDFFSDLSSPEIYSFTRCSVFGHGNVLTFDDEFFVIDMTCEVALVEIKDLLKVTVTLREGPYTGQAGAIKSIKITKGPAVQTITVSDTDDGNYTTKVIKAYDGRVIETPEFHGPYEVTKIYDRIRIKEDDLVTVEIAEDGSYAHIIVGEAVQIGSTKGLCGNYNQNFLDDPLTPDGNIPQTNAMLISSWKQDSSCDEPVAIGELTISESNICKQLKTVSFIECRMLSTYLYEESCKTDMRHCDIEKDKRCQCASFTQYSQDCLLLDLTQTLNWRSDRCEMECPSNQVYSDCAPYCERSCKNVGIGNQCPDTCINGCTCPEGKYLDGDDCVLIEDCSCHVGDEIYRNGEKKIERCRDCVCQSGTLVCTTKNCDGTAIVFGNPHYLTFDGLWYTYDGVCQYSLLNLNDNLNVKITTELCGTESAFTCIDHLTITSVHFKNVNLMKFGIVEYGDTTIELPHTDPNLEIRRLTSQYISVYIVNYQVKIKWSLDGVVIISISDSLKNVPKGMLGNFNDLTIDEYRGPNGMVQNTVQAFGDLWQTNPSTCDGAPPTGEDTCVLINSDRGKCQAIIEKNTAFKSCLSGTNSEGPMVRFCQESLCAVQTEQQKEESICIALSVLATLCARNDHIVDWRNSAFCNMTCTNGKEYKPWTTSCGRTCQGITEEETCTSSQQAEGCVCPDGMYEDHIGDCVESSSCHCFVGGIWHPNEDYFTHNGEDCYCKAGEVTCTGTEEVNCTGGMELSKCGSDNCLPTCENKNLKCGQDCQPGCACPNGTIYENGNCISDDECQCKADNVYYKSGESLISENCEHCICKNGDWSCVTTTLCSRSCSVTSGSYVETFDSARYHSGGTCNYKLMTDKCTDSPDEVNYFEIDLQSHPCEGSEHTMCNVTIRARFGHNIFVLSRDEEIKHSFTSYRNRNFYDVLYSVVDMGFYHVIEADYPGYYIQLSYDKATTVRLQVSRNITEEGNNRKVCGLCGNLDGSSTNDISTEKNGVSNVLDFINSWRNDPECAATTIAIPSKCLDRPQAEENAIKQCGIIKGVLFEKCHSLIDPSSYYDTCVEETCSCDTGGECECFCSSVAAYANACGRRGAKVNWRIVTSCPVNCEEFTDPSGDICDIKYDVCRDCAKTCCQRCTRGCFEGCYKTCGDGLVYDVDRDVCVTAANCRPCIPPATSVYTTTAPSTTGLTTETGGTTVVYTTTKETWETTTQREETTTGRCATICTFINENDTSEIKAIGQEWDNGCNKFKCTVDTYGCAFTLPSQIMCALDNTVCDEYQLKVMLDTAKCCPEYECKCAKCIVGDNIYAVSETWEENDCVTMECTPDTCPSGKIIEDKKDNCTTTDSGECDQLLGYDRVKDNLDPCCDTYKCECNEDSCPANPECVGGSIPDSKLSNECCNVTKCLPTCLYNGEEFKNGTLVDGTNCFDEYCRCTADVCSIFKENEVVCEPSPKCTNDDTVHFPATYNKDKCCKTNQCKCECKVYGDPHYASFDGKHYKFHGVCQYVLVTYRDSDRLKIIADNTACMPDIENVSCLKSITVIWEGTTIVLDKGNTVSVNGVQIEKLPIYQGGISVRAVSNDFIKLIINEVQLLLEYKSTVQESLVFISLPMTRWFNETVGLCGTCSNTRDDDFETSHKNKTTIVDEFASSWEYNSTDKVCLPCEPPDHKSCWNCSDPRHGVDIPAYCSKPCDQQCEFLKNEIFEACSMDVESYYQSCLYDAKSEVKCETCESPAIAAYGDSCKCVKWREASNCLPTCPVGQEYRECVSECDLMKSCINRNTITQMTDFECDAEVARGCGCPNGTILRDSNSNECIEERCCDCEDPICKDYETLELDDGQDANDCCPKKSCVCKPVESAVCVLPEVSNTTDSGTPGCFRDECYCPEEPDCPILDKSCSGITGCVTKIHYGKCGCAESIECQCDQTQCPTFDSCPKCTTSELYDIPKNDSQACDGSCCQAQRCNSIECAPVISDILIYPTLKCPFIKRIGTSFKNTDTDSCCPGDYDLECIPGICAIPVNDCSTGYTFEIVAAADSSDPAIQIMAGCPRVDECCLQKTCKCSSCTLADGTILALGDAAMSDNGCKMTSCTTANPQEDGCYEESVTTPYTCPAVLSCQCNQHLNYTAPVQHPMNESQYIEKCCGKYECIDNQCSKEYNTGPQTCEYPATRKVTYENAVDGCEDKQCPVASCVCDLCIDSNNNSYSLGSVYSEGDPCENFTCTQGNSAQCPEGVSNRITCNEIECDSQYYLLTQTEEKVCCPKQECICKPYKQLESICENWKNDSTSCPDPEHMKIEIDKGKYQDSICCPQKNCVCKGEDTVNCPKWTDYECPLENQMRVETQSINETNCCPDYECKCDYSKVTCDYKSWAPSSDSNTCDCVCDPNLCAQDLIECGQHEILVEDGTTDKGCCTKYKCVCIKKSECPSLSSITCNKYQEEYDWYSSPDACCPEEEKRCRCISNNTALTEMCMATRNTAPSNCSEGWEPYVANMTSAIDEGICCDIQCRCISCFTEDGDIQPVGSTWTIQENCTIYENTCSDDKLSNSCHKIKTITREPSCEFNSLKQYEASECKSGYYAVSLPSTKCCPQYECRPCSSNNQSCSIFESMISNATHERCPGECICTEPLSKEQLTLCYTTAECEENMEAGPVNAGSNDGTDHLEICCPKYNCSCSTCPSSTVTEDDVNETIDTNVCEKVGIKESDKDATCCQNYEQQCDETCTCPESTKNCSSTTGCLPSTRKNACGCVVDITCECNLDACPKKTCSACETLVTTKLKPDSAAECLGNCCDKLKCEPTPCPSVSEKNISEHCTFISQKPIYGEDKCCPNDMEIICNGTCPYNSQNSCSIGYDLKTINVKNSVNPLIYKYADCQKVDDCCPLKFCQCNSCKLDNETVLLMGETTMSVNGCEIITCTSDEPQPNGCYETIYFTPYTCPAVPTCQCYQYLNYTAPVQHPINESQYIEKCCGKHECIDNPCSDDYNPGPETCDYPAKRQVTFENAVDGCEDKQCPVASCECNLCIDSNNNSHSLGSVYSEGDPCENFTCTQGNSAQCPKGVSNRITCDQIECDPYNYLITQTEELVCCPKQECKCKPYKQLESVCENWKNDSTLCPDPEHMKIEIDKGKYQDSICCPQKNCVCKGEDTVNCPKWTDYECPQENQMRVETQSIDETNCCPDYECQCNCSEVECPAFETATTSDDVCCQCICDPKKCPPAPLCGEHESLNKTLKPDECCYDYIGHCICNSSLCPIQTPPECPMYQKSYPDESLPRKCCPDFKCECIKDTSVRAEACGGLNDTCPDGYTKSYKDSDTECCPQCTCNICIDEDGMSHEPGDSWEIVEDNCKIKLTCSSEKETGLPRCHKIIKDYENDTCIAIEAFAEQCEELEYPSKIPKTSYQCCTDYRCQCITNDTILQDKCDNYDGIECPPFQRSEPSWFSSGCCPEYTCGCDYTKCKYTCDAGYIANKVNEMDVLTSLCCNTYTCLCNTCDLGNDQSLTVGESSNEEIHSGCNKIKTCKRENGKCKVSEINPLENCQTLVQYQAEHCKTPYQIAVDTREYLENQLCCIKYKCECNNTAMQCPDAAARANCHTSQDPVSKGVIPGTGDCCADYSCECKSQDELVDICPMSADFNCSTDGYVRNEVSSADPCCRNFTCSCDPSTCKNNNIQCEIGFMLIEKQSDQCCPDYECRCVACVVNGVAHPVNKSWSEDSCTILTCSVEDEKCPKTISRKKYECDPIDVEDCENKGGIVKGTEKTEGCCKECTLCKRVERLQNLTKTINGDECRSVESVDLGSCEGACPTTITVDWVTGTSNAVCACCEPTIQSQTVLMLCDTTDEPATEFVSTTVSCKCTSEP